LTGFLIYFIYFHRGLEFIHELALQYVSGVHDLGEAATTAYGKTLKCYHSWVVRGVFGVSSSSFISIMADVSTRAHTTDSKSALNPVIHL